MMNNEDSQLGSYGSARLGTRRSWTSFSIHYSLFIIPLAFLAIFLLYPLLAVLRLSFAEGIGGLLEALSEPYYWRVLGFTTWQAALSTALTMAFGLPGAYVFARFEFPGKAALRALAGLPFVLPTVVVAVAFGALLGPRGLLNGALQAALGLAQPPLQLQGTLGLVLLAHVFYNYTLVLRLVGGLWASLDLRLEQAAAVLGASRRRALWEVTLPLLTPAAGAAALLTFIFCFTSFGVILVLGGPRMATIEVEIYRQTAQLLRLDVAATLALAQAGLTLALSLAYARLAERSAVPLELQPRRAVSRRPRGSVEWLLVASCVALILGLVGAPLLALAARSLLAPAGAWPPLTLEYYRALGENRTGSAFFVTPAEAIANSLRVALSSTLVALAVGLPAAYLLAGEGGERGQGGKGTRERFPALRFPLSVLLDGLFMLPLGVSAATLGLGYIVALSVPGLAWLRSSPWLLPALHALVALPFVVRSLLPALRARSPRQREAAAMLGAGPMRSWLLVELPQLTPAIVTAAIFAFTVSLGEFGATLLLARPDAPTMPVMIFRLLGMPGAINYGQALAMSCILMLVTAAGFLLLERVRPPGSEF